MVTVRLKGVHVIRTTLADGSRVAYHYAWKGKGAPRLTGAPGSPEYVASFQEAHRARKQPQTGTLRDVIVAYKASGDYTKLSDHTKRAYARYLDLIDAKFGKMLLGALDEAKIKRHFRSWRDSMAATPRTADYAVGVLKTLIEWGVEGEYFAENYASKIKRLHRVDRSDSIWTVDDFTAFERFATKELRWAVRLAAFTGLRQGDLINVVWTHYDGTSFQLRTSKRGKVVTVPAIAGCRRLMGEIEKRQAVVLTTHRGKRRWTADGLRSSFAKACADSGVKRTFHDLRRTAATQLLMSGIEASQVAMIMGWAESDVEQLKLKYVSRKAVVAAVLAKLEKGL